MDYLAKKLAEQRYEPADSKADGALYRKGDTEAPRYQVGDKVRLTGEGWRGRSEHRGAEGAVHTLRPSPGNDWLVFGAGWRVDDDKWSAIVVERGGCVVPENLIVGDVMSCHGDEITVVGVSTLREHLIIDCRNGTYRYPLYVSDTFRGGTAFVRPAGEPSAAEVIIDSAHYRQFTADAFEQATSRTRRAPPVMPPEYATSIAHAAVSGLEFVVDRREELCEAQMFSSNDPREDDRECGGMWEIRVRREILESLTAEARRTLREWPTGHDGVPMRIAARSVDGVFYAKWEA